MYTTQNHIDHLKFKIGIEEAFCHDLDDVREKIDREHFINGMKYALDLLQDPDGNGISEVLE
jgi:hypothetical protein